MEPVLRLPALRERLGEEAWTGQLVAMAALLRFLR